MRIFIISIFFSYSFICNAADIRELQDLYNSNPAFKDAVHQLSNETNERWKRSHGDIRAIFKEDFQDDAACIHCPSHFKLAGDVNKIIEKMPTSPKDSAIDKELVPIKLNKLKFLYYVSQINSSSNETRCENHLLRNGEESVKDMKGTFKLAYEDILPYSDVVELQLYTPESEEVVYYYRGEGSQSNVFIEAVLRPHGKATFRYFYYTPPEVKVETVAVEADKKDKDNSNSALVDFLKSDSFRYEHRGIIPKNLHLLEVETQHTFYENYTLKTSNDLSVLGNNFNLSLKDSKNNKDIATAEVKIKSASSKIEYRANVPYEIGYYKETKVKTNTTIDNNGESVKLTLTDYDVDWFNVEARRDSQTGKETFYMEKVTTLAPKETLSTSYGVDNRGSQYLALQHKQTLAGNATMVIDVRHDIGGETSLMYQFQKKF